MDEATNEFTDFLEANKPFVHIILSDLFTAVKGKYTKQGDVWTKMILKSTLSAPRELKISRSSRTFREN